MEEGTWSGARLIQPSTPCPDFLTTSATLSTLMPALPIPSGLRLGHVEGPWSEREHTATMQKSTSIMFLRICLTAQQAIYPEDEVDGVR
jgi:hypothetical protein